MPPPVTNIFARTPAGGKSEEFVTLLKTPGLRLEQILSHGQPTAADHWYDQVQPEWVVLLQGTARLRFEGDGLLVLAGGDSILIPARSRHRVESCSHDACWLALHFSAGPPH
jgi:cupin 2 domain-containing protein